MAGQKENKKKPVLHEKSLKFTCSFLISLSSWGSCCRAACSCCTTVKYIQLQTKDTSSSWHDIMCRFWGDYHRFTVECITCLSREIRAQEPHHVLTVKILHLKNCETAERNIVHSSTAMTVETVVLCLLWFWRTFAMPEEISVMMPPESSRFRLGGLQIILL